jgi:hypothetical protein
LIGSVKMDAATNFFHFYYDAVRAAGSAVIAWASFSVARCVINRRI